MPAGVKFLSFVEPSGYGMAALAYVRALVNAGVPVRWVPVRHGTHGVAPVAPGEALPLSLLATDDRRRTRSFAWLGVLQDGGHALGGLAAGLPALLGDGDDLAVLRLTMAVPAAVSFLSAALYLGLSAAVEAGAAASGERRLTPESRGIVARLAALFAVDSVAGGFLATALLAYFLAERFGVGGGMLGPLFFVARVANAGSHLGAAWLAARIGLVNTMVFTHIPSSLLLITIPWAPSFPVAAALFVLREGLVEMDVPTRQSYTMAVVRPEERTTAAGLTNLVRLAGWAVGPAVAGALMQGGTLAGPLYVGAAMKIAYDLLLYRAFRHQRPPEERVAGLNGGS